MLSAFLAGAAYVNPSSKFEVRDTTTFINNLAGFHVSGLVTPNVTDKFDGDYPSDEDRYEGGEPPCPPHPPLYHYHYFCLRLNLGLLWSIVLLL